MSAPTNRRRRHLPLSPLPEPVPGFLVPVFFDDHNTVPVASESESGAGVRASGEEAVVGLCGVALPSNILTVERNPSLLYLHDYHPTGALQLDIGRAPGPYELRVVTAHYNIEVSEALKRIDRSSPCVGRPVRVCLVSLVELAAPVIPHIVTC